MPLELSTLIFEACATRTATHGHDWSALLFNKGAYAALKALCLLCTRLVPAAQSVLYHTVGGLTPDNADRLLRTLDHAPELARRVRRMGIGIADGVAQDGIFMVSGAVTMRLLEHLTGLAHLEIWSRDDEAVRAFVKHPVVMPRVLRLDVVFCFNVRMNQEMLDAALRLVKMAAADVVDVRLDLSTVIMPASIAALHTTVAIPPLPKLRHLHWQGGPESVVVALLRSARQSVRLVTRGQIPDLSGEPAASRIESLDFCVDNYGDDAVYGTSSGPRLAALVALRSLTTNFRIDLTLLHALPRSLHALAIGGDVASLATARAFVADAARSANLRTVQVTEHPRAWAHGHEEDETGRRALEAACQARGIGIAVDYRSV